MNTNIHLYTYVDTTAYPPQLVGPSGCLSRHGLGHPPVHQRNAIRGTRPAAPTGPRPGENTGRGQVRPPTTPGPPATAQRAVGVGGGSAVAGCTESRACFEWVGGGGWGSDPDPPGGPAGYPWINAIAQMTCCKEKSEPKIGRKCKFRRLLAQHVENAENPVQSGQKEELLPLSLLGSQSCHCQPIPGDAFSTTWAGTPTYPLGHQTKKENLWKAIWSLCEIFSRFQHPRGGGHSDHLGKNLAPSGSLLSRSEQPRSGQGSRSKNQRVTPKKNHPLGAASTHKQVWPSQAPFNPRGLPCDMGCLPMPWQPPPPPPRWGSFGSQRMPTKPISP